MRGPGRSPSASYWLIRRNAYWLALALLLVVYALCALAVRSEAGHVWQAIRENTLRTRVLGYDVHVFPGCRRVASGGADSA